MILIMIMILIIDNDNVNLNSSGIRQLTLRALCKWGAICSQPSQKQQGKPLLLLTISVLTTEYWVLLRALHNTRDLHSFTSHPIDEAIMV